MQVRVLGELQVEVDGALVDLGGPKPRALVGLLVAAEGRPVPVEHLIDQMWGGSPPSRVEVSMQTYVARLRRSLEPARDSRTPARILRTHTGAYSLEVPAGDVDARRFVDLLRSADDAREARLSEALDLWHGPAYGGLSVPALEAEGARLEELRLTALEELWELRLGAGAHLEAAAELERLVGLHPLRESLWALLARALYLGSRQGDALAVLRRAREHLADELGVDPGPELRRLEEQVLRHDPALDPAPRLEAPRPGATVGGPLPRRAEVHPSDRHGLLGREDALAAVEGVLDDAVAGWGRAVVISGEPGIGKSRVLDAVLGAAAERGFRTGRGGWEDEGAPPLWGWRRAITELLGSAQVLDSAGTDATTASFRQGAALVEALPPDAPALLVLDDVHWADADSLRLLRRVSSEVARTRLVVVVALRDQTLAAAPAADALAALARVGAVRIDLTGLRATDVREWVATQTGVALDQAAADRLVERSGGNPFYITELVRLLVSEGALGRPQHPSWDAVPTGVRDVVRQRLAQLDPERAEVLHVAACCGREFDHAVLTDACGSSPEAVEEALETFHALGLATETGPGSSRFTHALVRDAVHAGVSSASRARTHAAVATALESRYAGRVARHAAELAEHYRLAGPAYVRSAWHFAATAADQAGHQSAHDESLRLVSSAIDLQEQDPEASPAERERLLLGRARALIGLARTLEAWDPVEQATRSALGRGDVEGAVAALLTITQDFVWGWRLHPHYDDAAIELWAQVREAAASAGAVDAVAHAMLTAGLAFECFFKPELGQESTRLAELAVASVREATADPAARLRVVQLSLAALLRPDLVERRQPLYDEFVELGQRAADPSRLSAALTGRAGDRGELGRLEEARSDVTRAHELAERHRLTQNLMVTGWSRSVLLQLEARWEEATALLDQVDAFGATLSVSGQDISLAQRAIMAELTGRLPQMRETLSDVAAYHPAYRELHALAVIRSGEAGRARMLLGPWREQPPLPLDYMWTTSSTLRSWVWIALGDVEAAADLRRQLAPYAGRLVFGAGTITFLGSVHHWLGALARTEGDRPGARHHLAEALRVHIDLGLGHWAERTRTELAALD